MNDFKKNAVVTGGSSGIGLAIVKRLLADDFRVGFFGSSREKVEAVSETLESESIDPASFIARTVDLRATNSIRPFFEEIEKTMGGIGVLVNNAGISPRNDGRRVTTAETTLEQWQDVLAVNLTGALVCTQCVLPQMIRVRFGRIVMIGSMAARTLPRIAGSAYVASKAGLSGLTRCVTAEYSAFGITANNVSPGNITSEITGDSRSAYNMEAVKRIPAGRIGEPHDIAGIVSFLCSEDAGFINGATIDATGGEYVAC